MNVELGGPYLTKRVGKEGGGLSEKFKGRETENRDKNYLMKSGKKFVKITQKLWIVL